MANEPQQPVNRNYEISAQDLRHALLTQLRENVLPLESGPVAMPVIHKREGKYEMFVDGRVKDALEQPEYQALALQKFTECRLRAKEPQQAIANDLKNAITLGALGAAGGLALTALHPAEPMHTHRQPEPSRRQILFGGIGGALSLPLLGRGVKNLRASREEKTLRETATRLVESTDVMKDFRVELESAYEVIHELQQKNRQISR